MYKCLYLVTLHLHCNFQSKKKNPDFNHLTAKQGALLFIKCCFSCHKTCLCACFINMNHWNTKIKRFELTCWHLVTSLLPCFFGFFKNKQTNKQKCITLISGQTERRLVFATWKLRCEEMQLSRIQNQNLTQICSHAELSSGMKCRLTFFLSACRSAGRLQMQELQGPRRATGALRLRPRTSPATDDCSRRRRRWTR